MTLRELIESLDEADLDKPLMRQVSFGRHPEFREIDLMWASEDKIVLD